MVKKTGAVRKFPLFCEEGPLCAGFCSIFEQKPAALTVPAIRGGFSALHQLVQCPDKFVDFLRGIVESQGRPDRAFEPEVPVYRLGAVMPGADRDAPVVEMAAYLLEAVPFQHKREDACLCRRGPDKAQARHAGHFFHGVAEELMLPGRDVFDADGRYVVQSRAKPYGVGDIAGSGLEFSRGLLVHGPLKGNIGDHVAAPLIGPGRLQHVAFPVKHADTCGAEDLVPGKEEEIRVQSADIYRQVGNRLGAVDEDPDPPAVGYLYHFRRRGNGSQGVGHLGYRREPGTAVEKPGILGKDDLPGLVDGRNPQYGPGFPGYDLLWDDVGVVFQHGKDDLIPGLQVLPDIGLRGKVYPLGGAPDKNDVFRPRRADKPGGFFPGILVGIG